MSGKTAVIVTTAAPPWQTGTSLNALHRAKAMSRLGWHVSLLLPWLVSNHQELVFPAGLRFSSQDEQASWIQNIYAAGKVRIIFYPAWWSARWRSIFPRGSLAPHLPAADLLVLEEPEHLGMFQPWMAIRRQVQAGTVLGIIHTNYAYYLQSGTAWGKPPRIQAALCAYLGWIASRSCDRVIRLSAAVPALAGASVIPVNGVDERYLSLRHDEPLDGLYFIGKLIWEKGLREMIECLAQTPGNSLHVFGTGEAQCVTDLHTLASRHGVKLVLRGHSATPWADLLRFKVFINCSRSEVLCTATAEALAMGKFALVPKHPSNDYFSCHPNCLVYDSPEEFNLQLSKARSTEPARVAAVEIFSWDAATSRLLGVLDSMEKGRYPS